MNLQLALNGEYFCQIKYGEKLEEYRLFTPYWKKRLKDRAYDKLILTLGYPKISDTHKRIEMKYDGYSIRIITHKHFGDNAVKVFAINCDAFEQSLVPFI